MKILVTTPTGKIGREIVKELLAPEFSVRVITRDPARLPREIREELEVVPGSTDDAQALAKALDGVEALFWCVPTERVNETKVRGHYERFARAGCQAVRKAGTPRVVTVSADGKTLARSTSSISGLHAMEDIMNESGAAIRHLRCGQFMENFLQELQATSDHWILSYPMPGHIPLPLVSVADVADAALRLLVRRDWEGIDNVAVHGPEDLSYGQVVAIMERVLERPVRYEEASTTDYAQTLVGSGASVEYVRSRVDMFAELAKGITGANLRTNEFTTATTFSAWIRSKLLPMVDPLALQPAPRSELETTSTCMCMCQI